jgi:anaerobic selenocysteine-containing dehydrogenase
MGKKDKDQGGFQLSRRDFLKVAGAGAAAVAIAEPLMVAPAAALTYDSSDIVGGVPKTTTFITTCPYCSAQCGQRVVVGDVTKKVYDVYGDVESPTNNGGLCSKGAGSFQLVNNARRLGVPEHTDGVDGKDFTGPAWKRIGDGAWQAMPLRQAMYEIAAGDHYASAQTFARANGSTYTVGIGAGDSAHDGLVAIRNTTAAWTNTAPFGGQNATTVQFFGSSHMNNEQNYTYRKIIAAFGTSRVEHQARI